MARKYPLRRGGKHRRLERPGSARSRRRRAGGNGEGEGQLGAPEQRLGELSRGLVHELALEAGGALGRLEEPLRAFEVGGRRREDAVDRLDLARVDHPLAVVAVLERAARGEDEAEVVAEPGVRPVEHLEARGAGGRDHACEGVVGGSGADRQHRHAERGSEIRRAEDERFEPVSGGGDPLGLDEAARRLDLGLEADPVREQLGRGGHVLRGLDLGEYDDVGTRLRRRTEVVLPPRRRPSVDAERGRPAERFALSAATASSRACSLSSAATASSRSTITSSAGSEGAFASIRSLDAGTVRQERRARCVTREHANEKNA